MNSLKCLQKYFKIGAIFDWEPMKLLQLSSSMIMNNYYCFEYFVCYLFEFFCRTLNHFFVTQRKGV